MEEIRKNKEWGVYMNILSKNNDGEIMLSLEGRIDAITSPQLQEEIVKAFQKSNGVMLDFEKVEYISSAGLRALLIGHKTAQSKHGYMRLKNVSEMVRDVLEMTGFNSVLDIQ